MDEEGVNRVGSEILNDQFLVVRLGDFVFVIKHGREDLQQK